MRSPVVWFDKISENCAAETDFLRSAFGWTPNDIGPMMFFTPDGQDTPVAATNGSMASAPALVPLRRQAESKRSTN